MLFEIFLTSVYGLTIYHHTLGIMCVYSLEIFRDFCFGSVCIYMYVCSFIALVFFLRIGGIPHPTPTITGPGMWWSMTGCITMLTRTFSG